MQPDFRSRFRSLRRKATDHIATLLAMGAAVLVLAPLVAIFAYLIYRGAGALNWAFLTQAPKPVGEPGGGMGNAIAGSIMILLVASAIGVPLGIGTGIYLAEYGRGRFATSVRFFSDVLNAVPSIVIGMAVYALVVVPQHHFSGFSGGVALGIMMVPTVARTTEEMLLMVPRTIREAALGLGISQWRTTLSVTLRTASSGVITGIMLAFARVAGETAPLLFTSSLVGPQTSWNPLHALQTVPLAIFELSESPDPKDHARAWAAAFVLLLFILLASLVARWLATRNVRKIAGR
jgi:phosphate transport system permease protein